MTAAPYLELSPEGCSRVHGSRNGVLAEQEGCDRAAPRCATKSRKRHARLMASTAIMPPHDAHRLSKPGSGPSQYRGLDVVRNAGFGHLQVRQHRNGGRRAVRMPPRQFVAETAFTDKGTSRRIVRASARYRDLFRPYRKRRPGSQRERRRCERKSIRTERATGIVMSFPRGHWPVCRPIVRRRRIRTQSAPSDIHRE